DIPEIGSHRHEDFVEPNVGSHIPKRSIAEIFVKFQGRSIVGKTKVGTRGFIYREVIAGSEQVGPAVVVIVKKPSGKTATRARHTSLNCDLVECLVVVVMV